MAIEVACQFSLSINQKPVELMGSFLPAKGKDDKGGVDVHLTPESLATLRSEPLGKLEIIAGDFAKCLGIGDTGGGLFERITGELEKVPPLHDAIEAFKSIDLYLTDLEFKSHDTFKIGIMLGVGEAIPPIASIQVVSLGVTLTVDLKEKSGG